MEDIFAQPGTPNAATVASGMSVIFTIINPHIKDNSGFIVLFVNNRIIEYDPPKMVTFLKNYIS